MAWIAKAIFYAENKYLTKANNKFAFVKYLSIFVWKTVIYGQRITSSQQYSQL